MKEPTRTLAWICPKCRQSVVVERTVFALTASASRLPCPCGKSELKVEPAEDHFRLSVPCVSCGKEHTVTCSQDAFLHRKAIALSCSASGLDCLYVGEEEPVYAALRRLEQAADLLPGEKEEQEENGETEPSAFLNPTIMEEVLGELRDIARRENGVTCTCGSKRWRMKVGYSAVDLTCADCGATLRLPAATDSDLDDLCCKTRLVIRSGGAGEEHVL